MNVKHITLEQLNKTIKDNSDQPMKRRALLIVRSLLKDKGCDMENISDEIVRRIVKIRRAGEEASANACMDSGDETLYETYANLDEALSLIPDLLFNE